MDVGILVGYDVGKHDGRGVGSIVGEIVGLTPIQVTDGGESRGQLFRG